MKSGIVILLFLIVSLFVISNRSRNWTDKVYNWDISGYHLHLPAAIIYGDINKLAFYSRIDDVYRPTGELRNYCLYDLENGNRVNRYSVGVAVLEIPFFLVAHAINILFLDYARDGYSLPYQWATMIGSVFWVAIGLLFLSRFLCRYFNDNVVALTLLAIAFGTNLYTYVIFTPGMSHTYSFFCYSLLIYLTDLLYKHRKNKSFYLLGITLGLIGLIRIPNLVVALVPLLWGVYNGDTLVKRHKFLRDNFSNIVAGTLCFVVVMMIQLTYWKYVTGTWLYNGYTGEGFIWSEPAIIRGLFSFYKGWFVYTPMALLAVSGIYCMRYNYKQYIPAVGIFMLASLYVVFSWWNWWYGGGFSARALIETFAILAFPLATLINSVNKKSTVIKSGFYLTVSFFVFLNMFQSYQFSKGIFNYELNSREYYFRTFLRTNVGEEDYKFMLPDSVIRRIYDERTIKLKR